MPDPSKTTTQKILDILERTAVTAGEALLAVYLAKGTLTVSGAEVALITAIAGGIAALRTLVSQLVSPRSGPMEWIEDALSRVIFTFAQTLTATLIVSAATPLTMSAVKSAAIAAAAAAFASIKAALARGVQSDPIFSPASLLPAITE